MLGGMRLRRLMATIRIDAKAQQTLLERRRPELYGDLATTGANTR
jgi:hypothetical protein